jgi:hypothetical protein
MPRLPRPTYPGALHRVTLPCNSRELLAQTALLLSSCAWHLSPRVLRPREPGPKGPWKERESP